MQNDPVCGMQVDRRMPPDRPNTMARPTTSARRPVSRSLTATLRNTRSEREGILFRNKNNTVLVVTGTVIVVLLIFLAALFIIPGIGPLFARASTDASRRSRRRA